MRKALGEIKGESVVPGVAVGELGIDAVERNGNAEAAGEAESFCECDLCSVTARNQRGERRVGAGGAEEIKECRSGDDADGAGAVLTGITEARGARGQRCASRGRKRDASLLHTGGRDDVKRGNASGADGVEGRGDGYGKRTVAGGSESRGDGVGIVASD